MSKIGQPPTQADITAWTWKEWFQSVFRVLKYFYYSSSSYVGVSDILNSDFIPEATFHIQASPETLDNGLFVEMDSQTSNPVIALLRADGDYTTKLSPNSGDTLGALSFKAYNAAYSGNWSTGASIVGVSRGSPSSNIVAGELNFQTSDGVSNPQTRMIIDKNGNIGYGNGVPDSSPNTSYNWVMAGPGTQLLADNTLRAGTAYHIGTSIEFTGDQWKMTQNEKATIFRTGVGGSLYFWQFPAAAAGTIVNVGAVTPTFIVDSTGNFGFNSTPGTASSGITGIKYGATAYLHAETASGTTNSLGFAQNGEYTGGTWKYLATATAASMYLYSGGFVFRNAVSGTAGNAITWTNVFEITSSKYVTLTGNGADTIPTWAAAPVAGEIHAQSSAAGSDYGFLRLSAGGGTTLSAKAGIDIQGYGATDASKIRMYASSANIAEFNSTGLGIFGAPSYPLDVIHSTAHSRICNALIGNFNGSSSFAMFGHSSVTDDGASYSLLQQNDGTTYLNAKTGKPIYFRINNGTLGSLDGTSGWWFNNVDTVRNITVSQSGSNGPSVQFHTGSTSMAWLRSVDLGLGQYVLQTVNGAYSAAVLSFQTTTGGAFGIRPENDNHNTLGASGFRWSAVWAANGTIQTSDARVKNSVANSVLGLDFINSLRPVSYKFNHGGNDVEELPPKKDENGKDIPDANNHRLVPRPGKRTHWGLVAQEVKAAVDAAGVEDFAGWIKTDLNDPDSEEGLNYQQFIAPMIKAIQELTAKVKALEAKAL